MNRAFSEQEPTPKLPCSQLPLPGLPEPRNDSHMSSALPCPAHHTEPYKAQEWKFHFRLGKQNCLH